MSTEKTNVAVLLYVQKLKSHFGVKSDEELGEKIGLSKQAIANWRRRGRVPLKLQQRMMDNYGLSYQEWDIAYDSPEGDIIYGTALYAYGQLVKGRSLSPAQWRTLGQSFPSTLRVIQDRLRGIYVKEAGAEALLTLLIASVDSGQFPEFQELQDELD